MAKLFLFTVKDFFKSPNQVQSFVWVEIFLLSRNLSSAVGTTEKGRKRTGLRRSGVTSSCSSPSFLINALSSLPLSLSLCFSLFLQTCVSPRDLCTLQCLPISTKSRKKTKKYFMYSRVETTVISGQMWESNVFTSDFPLPSTLCTPLGPWAKTIYLK